MSLVSLTSIKGTVSRDGFGLAFDDMYWLVLGHKKPNCAISHYVTKNPSEYFFCHAVVVTEDESLIFLRNFGTVLTVDSAKEYG